MQNIEFKAELRDLPLARGICATIGATRVGILEQTDTYYRLGHGRLKKRECKGEPVEFIFYSRDDDVRPRASHFTIYSKSEAAARFGISPLPIHSVVRKRRELFLLGNVRVHLDEVDGLGTFLEFEALVSDECPAERCAEQVSALRNTFAPVLGEPVSSSYGDLAAPVVADDAEG